ncbi:hypothetical protein HETIRDRAFT_313450 [Heterobasidion irregulare TC 32-1]|uniref:Protein BIG1 n=1 Tax=Heterobasidion irregulare (strain TC 32-1) TaxID=747525 RepID=W4KH86_HETIT|nr:uncharacterized protein HETIRDRAFT_313450 [Heterobasidion irregulare TC 32-1]ETW84406.1 hypothetical protein HETIRDRAFT_313450 [Heterobasidion irregulare TC 32-1]
MAGRVVLFASLIPFAFAFSDTVPIVAWSSHPSKSLDAFPSTHSTHSIPILESLLLNDDVCEYDAVVLVDQPGLHASDLRALSPSSPLTTLLSRSPSSVQLPYISRTAGSSVHDLADRISSRCGSRVLSSMPGQGGVAAVRGAKHVVCLSMMDLQGTAGRRKAVVADHESSLAHELDAIASAAPTHLVVFAGSSALAPRDRRRAEPALGALQQPGDVVPPTGGVLKRYQLLTPGLITSLLVAFFILLPGVFFGVSALASIQSPLRVEAPKGFSAQDKKTQ